MALPQDPRSSAPPGQRSYLWLPALQNATASLDVISAQHRLVTTQTLVPLPSYGITPSSTTDIRHISIPGVPDYCLSLALVFLFVLCRHAPFLFCSLCLATLSECPVVPCLPLHCIFFSSCHGPCASHFPSMPRTLSNQRARCRLQVRIPTSRDQNHTSPRPTVPYTTRLKALPTGDAGPLLHPAFPRHRSSPGSDDPTPST